MLIKLNLKLLNKNYKSLTKLNSNLLDNQLNYVSRCTSSISITLKDQEDDLPIIRSKHEKLYENKYFKNKNKDEFKSKLVDYFDEVGIDYTKMINKINHLDHPSIKAISFFANNYDNELVQIKKLVLNLFTHSLNQVYGEDATVQSKHNSQLMIAELIQLLHIVHQIHGNLVHLNEFESKNLHDGNKLSILSGDFLFAIVMKLLAKISNNDVTISITDAVHNLNIGQFILSASNDELITNMDVNKWLEVIDLVYAFSFRKGCESIAELIDVSVKVKQLAGEFGRNFALVLQASTELNQLRKFVRLNSQRNSNEIEIGHQQTQSPHPILDLSSTHIDLFQLPIILDCENLPALVRKVEHNMKDENTLNLKPRVNYEILKDHLPTTASTINSTSIDYPSDDYPATMQFIQLYANRSIQCLDKLFSHSKLETSDLLKDFIYTCLYLNNKM